MKPLRIIFMGTPEFAIPSLEILIKHNYQVVAVITAVDKPRGRGRKLAPSPVKEFALKHDIPVLQPRNLKDPEFVETLRSYQANLQVVVAFRMLPVVVWDMPEYGTFNLHASLLPQYRGAAPINWVLINGEKKTGLTTFFIRHDIDTGNIIFQEEEPVYPDDDAGSLHDRLMVRGAGLVLKTVRAIGEDNFSLTPQVNEPDLKPAPKIDREMCWIDWDQNQESIFNFVRGLSPYPAGMDRN
jgi:methionyl-tRNA formyltransferase